MMTESATRLFLFDGSALAYRSHFAFVKTPLSNDAGLNTGAILGYTRTLLKILESEAPTHLAVVFDTPEPTFRHAAYPEYKATREKMPEEMVEQLPWMKRMTSALNIPIIEIPGWEADDVIGTLARRAEVSGFEVRIVTGDKDFMQLVSPLIRLYDVMKPGSDLIVVDEKGVADKFGCVPDRVIEVLALMGDSSDNVPGVKGIGPKTATSLIEKYGSIDAIYADIANMDRSRTREALIAHEKDARLSRELVTIRCDAPVELEVRDLERKPIDVETATSLCRELKFNSLLSAFARLAPKRPPPTKRYETIRTAPELDALIDRLRSAGRFVVDTETTSLDRMEAVVIGLSFSTSSGEAAYVPLNLEPQIIEDAPGAALSSGVIDRLRPILEDSSVRKIGQNMKYDMSVLLNHEVTLDGASFDTMIASYLLEPGARAHDLDTLSLRHFDYTKIKTEELLGTGKDQRTMDQVPIDIVAEYAAEDADFTFRLFERFKEDLESKSLFQLFETVEMPLVPVLLRMEREGVRLDVGRLKKLEKELVAALDDVMAKIHTEAEEEFNIDSPKQLGRILFEKLKLHEVLGVKPQKTKTGFSTNQDVLESLSGHPLPAKIIEYRSLTKLLNTYVTELPKMVSRRTGRIHTTFNQTVAATGRLSSSDPNLQNIPIRSPLGRRIREAFVARSDDAVLFTADYSQIELRLMAHMSKDPTMIAAFESGRDIHRDTAARIFNMDPANVDATTRSRAKSINFGILYGMGPQRLSRETELSLDEAKEFIERYFASFPTVKAYIEGAKEKARTDGEVSTLFGRRRPIPDIRSQNGALRAAAENMAVNTPIQGTAADLIKIAMIRVDEWIRKEGLEGAMILQVHDELVFDVPKSELEVFRAKIPALMTGVVELDVPLVVETGSGENWSLAH